METPNIDGLWTKAALTDAIENDELADWKAMRYKTFHETMADKDTPYPCYFAVKGEEAGLFRYVFPDNPDNAEPQAQLANALETYLTDYESIGEITSLVVLFKPPPNEQSAEIYKRQFWNILNYLQENDPEPWPETIPVDPFHPKWRYCFAGEPVFIVARAPFYESRRSRYTPHGLEITIQPASVFDGLSGMSDKGQQARSTIRDRLDDYDDISRHPDLGDYVDPRKREWKQYMLPETNNESLVRCPLSERS